MEFFMKLFDSHAHLDDEKFDLDREEIIEKIKESEVTKLISAGYSLEGSKKAVEISKRYDFIYATCGISPNDIPQSDNELWKTLDEIKKLAKTNKKIVAIGEIGLDYHYGKEDVFLQQELFRKQLVLAVKYKLPVVIHSRDATEDTIHILKEFPDIKGDIHCFSGSLETAKQYISMGFMLGIGGVVTFQNSKLGSVIREIGLKSILLETDSPYLTPAPNRGKQNSSKYIPDIALKLSELVGVSFEEVSKITLENTYRLFDLL